MKLSRLYGKGQNWYFTYKVRIGKYSSRISVWIDYE